MSNPVLANKMLTIGVISGSGDLATAEYYKAINKAVNDRLGGKHSAEVIINSMDFAKSIHYVYGDLWDEGAVYIHAKAASLERAGADFLMIVSNTWHRAADKFMEGIKIPLLHIFDTTAVAIKKAGLRKVALLGTKLTMAGPYAVPELAKRAGVEVIVPDEDDQDYIDRVIIDELAQMIIKPESRKGYLDIITKLVVQGAEGIVLGCTEIPLLITQKDDPNVPMFDTLELHAKGAVAVAFGELAQPTR